MAKPRAAQFGKDIGVSTSEAKQLINKGRSRRDGGSVIMENNMNKMKYGKGGASKKPTVLPKSKPSKGDMNESKRVAPSLREIEDDKKAPKVKAKDGKYKKPTVLPKTPKQAVKEKKAKLRMEQLAPNFAERFGYEPVPLKRQLEAKLKGRATLLKEEVSPEILERTGESRKRKPTKPNPRELSYGGSIEAKDGKYMSCRGMGAAIQGGKFKGTK